jgi:histidyl-tRNA synthetase
MDTLNVNEREHIEQVLLKLEHQGQAPFVISQIFKSRSAGDLERKALTPELQEFTPETIPEVNETSGHEVQDVQEISDKIQEVQELSEAELEHIARIQAMIAETEAMDSSQLRREAPREEPKKSMFGGFKISGGGLKDALKVRSFLAYLF